MCCSQRFRVRRSTHGLHEQKRAHARQKKTKSDRDRTNFVWERNQGSLRRPRAFFATKTQKAPALLQRKTSALARDQSPSETTAQGVHFRSGYPLPPDDVIGSWWPQWTYPCRGRVFKFPFTGQLHALTRVLYQSDGLRDAPELLEGPTTYDRIGVSYLINGERGWHFQTV